MSLKPYGQIPRVKGSSTSEEAAELLEPVLGHQQSTVLEILRDAPRGKTDEQIERITGWKHQTVSARRRELVLSNLVHTSGEKRLNRESKRKAFVWEIGPAPMSNPNKDKGDRAEREVQALLRHHLGIPAIRRELGAGRKDDRGDIANVPTTAIQVADWRDLAAALRAKIPMVEQQRLNKRARFAAVFLRRQGGKYVVAMSTEQFVRLWKFAQIGVAVTREKKQTKLQAHGPRSTSDRSTAKKARDLG